MKLTQTEIRIIRAIQGGARLNRDHHSGTWGIKLPETPWFSNGQLVQRRTIEAMRNRGVITIDGNPTAEALTSIPTPRASR